VLLVASISSWLLLEVKEAEEALAASTMESQPAERDTNPTSAVDLMFSIAEERRMSILSVLVLDASVAVERVDSRSPIFDERSVMILVVLVVAASNLSSRLCD